MEKYNYTGLLRFANTAAGKVFTVIVAIVMVLSLSSIALAVDDIVKDIASNQKSEATETSGAGEAADTSSEEDASETTAENESGQEGQQSAIENTDEGTNTLGAGEGENDEAGAQDQSAEGEGAQGQQGESDQTTEDENAATAEGEGEGADENAEGTSASEGTGEGTSEGGEGEGETDEIQTTEDAIQEAITNTEEKKDPKENPINIEEANVTFNFENCTVQVLGQDTSASTIKWPLHTLLQFKVIPNKDYTVEWVRIPQVDTYPPSMLDLEANTEGVYTVEASLVESDLVVQAFASGNANPADPDPIEDDTEVIPDGYYDAPVITVPETLTFEYNGLAQPTSINIVQAQVSGLQPGDTLVLVGEPLNRPVNVKESGAIIVVDDYNIFRENSEGAMQEIKAKYKPATWKNQKIKINITKAPLYITTPSASKVYDGTPLTYAGSEDTGDAAVLEVLWNTYGPESGDFEVVGSQTEVGSSPNRYKLSNAFRNRVKDNYYLVEKLGTLRVVRSEGAAIIAPSDSKIYDAKPLTATEIMWDGLPEGYTVTGKVTNGSLTNVGTVKTGVDRASLKILDAQGKDVTKNFADIEIVPGELEVTPADLYVLTLSDTKTYDGTPLEAGGEIAGMFDGDITSFIVTGSQLAAGSSTNTYRIIWNGAEKQKNYRIIEDLGTLRVNAAPESNTGATTGGSGGSTGGGSAGGSDASGAGGSGASAGTSGGDISAGAGSTSTASPTFTARPAVLPSSENAASSENEDKEEGLNPTVERVATGLQNAEQVIRGEEPTPLAAPAVEETLADDETPLGVFDAPIECWVHWYSILGIIATAVYGGVVMFFRRAYAYELESREANVLGVPVGLAQPQEPIPGGTQAGRRA